MAKAAAAQQAVHAQVQERLSDEPPPQPPRHFFGDGDPVLDALIATQQQQQQQQQQHDLQERASPELKEYRVSPPPPPMPFTPVDVATLPPELRARTFYPASASSSAEQLPFSAALPFQLPWRGLRHALLSQPIGSTTLRGRLRRIRAPSSGSGGSGSSPIVRFEFSLELDECDGSHSPGCELLLLAAKKLNRALSTYYALSLNPMEISRDSIDYMGKLRASSIGAAEWMLFDNGVPRRHVKSTDDQDHVRRQLLGVRFTGSENGPPHLLAVVPLEGESGEMASTGDQRDASPSQFYSAGPPPAADEGQLLKTWRSPAKGASATAPSRAAVGSSSDPSSTLFGLESKAAIWDDDRQAFTLEYEGRAKLASVKNVQLVAARPPYPLPSGVADVSDPDHTAAPPPAADHTAPSQHYFQMGKIGDDEFTVDWRSPLSPIAAFGLALSICDAKLALAHKLDGVKRFGSAMRLSRPPSARVVGLGSGGAATAKIVPHPVHQPVGGEETSGGGQ